MTHLPVFLAGVFAAYFVILLYEMNRFDLLRFAFLFAIGGIAVGLWRMEEREKYKQ